MLWLSYIFVALLNTADSWHPSYIGRGQCSVSNQKPIVSRNVSVEKKFRFYASDSKVDGSLEPAESERPKVTANVAPTGVSPQSKNKPAAADATSSAESITNSSESIDEVENVTLKEAISKFTKGEIDKDSLAGVILAKEEQELNKQRAEMLAKKAALDQAQKAENAEKNSDAIAAALGAASVGLVVGGLADGYFANGGAPWASPLGAVIVGGAAFSAAAQDNNIGTTVRKKLGGASKSIFKTATDPIVIQVDNTRQAIVNAPVRAKKAVTRTIEDTTANIKAIPGRGIKAVQLSINNVKMDLLQRLSDTSSAIAAIPGQALSAIKQIPSNVGTAVAESFSAAQKNASASIVSAKKSISDKVSSAVEDTVKFPSEFAKDVTTKLESAIPKPTKSEPKKEVEKAVKAAVPEVPLNVAAEKKVDAIVIDSPILSKPEPKNSAETPVLEKVAAVKKPTSAKSLGGFFSALSENPLINKSSSKPAPAPKKTMEPAKSTPTPPVEELKPVAKSISKSTKTPSSNLFGFFNSEAKPKTNKTIEKISTGASVEKVTSKESASTTGPKTLNITEKKEVSKEVKASPTPPRGLFGFGSPNVKQKAKEEKSPSSTLPVVAEKKISSPAPEKKAVEVEKKESAPPSRSLFSFGAPAAKPQVTEKKTDDSPNSSSSGRFQVAPRKSGTAPLKPVSVPKKVNTNFTAPPRSVSKTGAFQAGIKPKPASQESEDSTSSPVKTPVPLSPPKSPLSSYLRNKPSASEKPTTPVETQTTPILTKKSSSGGLFGFGAKPPASADKPNQTQKAETPVPEKPIKLASIPKAPVSAKSSINEKSVAPVLAPKVPIPATKKTSSGGLFNFGSNSNTLESVAEIKKEPFAESVKKVSTPPMQAVKPAKPVAKAAQVESSAEFFKPALVKALRASLSSDQVSSLEKITTQYAVGKGGSARTFVTSITVLAGRETVLNYLPDIIGSLPPGPQKTELNQYYITSI